MVRTREFDASEALDKAMILFWDKGYADTSMDDLVKATGVSRYGIYGAFGNKRELYKQALERYTKMRASEALSLLAQPDASLPEVKRFFKGILQMDVDRARLGCMLCNTATEVAPHDQDIADEVQRHLRRVTDVFERALVNAKRKGEVADDFEPAEMSFYLTGIMQGAAVFGRAGFDRQQIRSFVENGLAPLD